MRSILIDPINRTVAAYAVSRSLASLQAVVGGLIAFATELDTGDVLYVNDSGMLRDDPLFFTIARDHQPYAGRGLLVGPERHGVVTDVIATVEDIKALVNFDIEVDLDGLLTVHSTTFNSIGDAVEYLHRQRMVRHGRK